jgi:hypothetical protein
VTCLSIGSSKPTWSGARSATISAAPTGVGRRPHGQTATWRSEPTVLHLTARRRLRASTSSSANGLDGRGLGNRSSRSAGPDRSARYPPPAELRAGSDDPAAGSAGTTGSGWFSQRGWVLVPMVGCTAGEQPSTMTAETGIALLLALVSACAINWGYLTEHQVASALPSLSPRLPLRSLRILLGSRSAGRPTSGPGWWASRLWHLPSQSPS